MPPRPRPPPPASPAAAGALTLTAFISPSRADRDMVRARCAPGEFLEVHMAVPLEVCEARDPKGLYKKARAGLIKNFTGGWPGGGGWVGGSGCEWPACRSAITPG